jgi:two-component system, OmpR family, sensor kinase
MMMAQTMRTTMAKPTTEGPDAAASDGLLASSRRLLGSVRVRLLLSYVALLAVAAVISVFVVRQVLLVRLDDRVQDNLEQEIDEFQKLAEDGIDPATGEPLQDDPKRLFRRYLQRNIPGEGEELVTIPRRGRPHYRQSERAQGYVIDERALIERWRSLETVERGEIETPIGEARYVAVPVRQGDSTVGAFVVANFIQGELEEVAEAVRIVAAVSAFVVLLGTAIAFLATSRVLAPVRELRDAARSVSEAEMTQRIDVRGNDELAELAQTFNRMLDRLEEAFSSQRNFLRDVGHELRTPITIVRGHLELLADPDAEADERADLDLVTDEVDRMSRFVEDLSLLARAQRPDFLRLETVRIGDLCEELVGKARNMAEREWTLESSSRRTVVADRQRVTQAVIGLIDNAVKHTALGDEIAIGGAVDGDEARLWVSDSGPGIDPDEMQTIFERFRRGRSGTAAYDGSGLGLAIAQAIAQAHGGRVEVASEPGEGARFTVVIPVDPEPIAHIERPYSERA